MSKKNPNSFGVQGSGSPNVITLKRPPPRSITRTQAVNFAVWLAVYAGDLDAFLVALHDVWGERYGEEEMPPWLLQLVGPYVPEVEVVAPTVVPVMARPRADRATTAPRNAPNAPAGLKPAPRVKAPPGAALDPLDGLDNNGPDPLRGRPNQRPTQSRAGGVSVGAPSPKPAARSRLTLNGQPLDRAGIAKVAAEVEAAITGAPVRRAAPTIDPGEENGGSNSPTVNSPSDDPNDSGEINDPAEGGDEPDETTETTL